MRPPLAPPQKNGNVIFSHYAENNITNNFPNIALRILTTKTKGLNRDCPVNFTNAVFARFIKFLHAPLLIRLWINKSCSLKGELTNFTNLLQDVFVYVDMDEVK